MTKYRKGKIVKATVSGIEQYGIFVNLDEYYSGLIHISEISNEFVKNIYDVVNIGEVICAKVIDVNDDEFHVKLSIRDIDYRATKRKRQKIVETASGFQPLADNLEVWVEKKLKEIQKN